MTLNPFRALQTFLLFKEIDKKNHWFSPDDPEERARTVASYLKMGADPWARNDRGVTVLGAVGTATPYPVAIDAWFKAAGNLKDEPWRSSGGEHPLLTATNHIYQPDIFRGKIFSRLLDAGATAESSDPAVKNLLGDVLRQFSSRTAQPLVERLFQISPALLDSSSTQAVLLDNEPLLGSLSRLLSPGAGKETLVRPAPRP